MQLEEENEEESDNNIGEDEDDNDSDEHDGVQMLDINALRALLVESGTIAMESDSSDDSEEELVEPDSKVESNEKKNVSYGGVLNLDYSSSDSDEEVEPAPLLPGASNKYKDFMQQLAALQSAAEVDASTANAAGIIARDEDKDEDKMES
jgi:hypothetical protein